MKEKLNNQSLQKKMASSPSLEVTNGCLVVHLNCELDHHYTTILREKSDRMIDKGNIKNIIFDFTGVHFMDSSGIGFVMGRYKRVIFTGGKVAVSGMDSSIDRIFHLSGLYKIIEKYDTVKDAVMAL